MRRTSWVVPIVAVAFAVAFAAGCASEGERTAATPVADTVVRADPWAGIDEAVAVVHPTHGNKVTGTVRFTDVAGGVRVVAEFEGLKPNAKHAFHVHEFGDCTSADGKSAGGHYNPEGHPHAGPDTEMRHAGDLGNVESDAKGNAHLDRVFTGISVAGARNPVLGRSVIIHASMDDFTTQPTGNAGDRIGCGVIGVAKPAGK